MPSRGVSGLRVSRIVRRLNGANMRSKDPLTHPGGPVVSLTSYGGRVNTVYLTIEAIAEGSVLPSRLILWLDDEAVFNRLPGPLLQLQRRGLEVRLTGNYGPHTKYYPYVETTEHFGLPLITADDDILYPRRWLEGLVQAYTERPDVINCYRARVVQLEAAGLSPYLSWQMCNSTEPTIRHFATGVSGVVYPPAFLAFLKRAGSLFMSCCPKADDIWLHVQALRSGYQVRQFVKRFLHFPMIPGTQHTALQISNWGDPGEGNDRQAAMTYSRQDLDILWRAVGGRSPGVDGRLDQQFTRSEAR